MTSKVGNMPRRRPKFTPAEAAPKQLNLKSLAMQAGANLVAARRRQKPIFEVICVYKACEKLQMDIKYLTDIPPYWEMMQRLKLPRFQYTVRDVKSGMLFLGFADEISELHAETMAKH